MSYLMNKQNLAATARLLTCVNGNRIGEELPKHAFLSLFDSSKDALDALEKDGLVTHSSVSDGVKNCSLSDLKLFLQGKDINATGKKDALADRIISSFSEEELKNFARPGTCYVLTDLAKEILNEYKGIYTYTLDTMLTAMLQGDASRAISEWCKYKTLFDTPTKGILNSEIAFDQNIGNINSMCNTFLSHDYSDIQNSEEYRRMVAAVFAMRELIGDHKSRWWVTYLASKSDEVFRCDELVRTSREYNNGYPDKRVPDGWFVDVMEVYHQTIWRRNVSIRDISKFKSIGATLIERYYCGKIGCECPHKDAQTSIPIDDAIVFPLRYGCVGRYKFGGL